jgi:Mrp family chromosome partitioning ATPase
MGKGTEMAMPVKNFSGLPFELRDQQNLAIKRSFRSVAIDLSCEFPPNELAKLYRMIEAALPDRTHRIIQFISAYKEEGASEIAFETAVIAARLIGLRVLFIDTATTLADKRKRKLPGSFAALETLLLAGGSPYDAIAQAAGTQLYFAMLCNRGQDGLAPVSLNHIGEALEVLRAHFDLIVVDSQAILTDAFGMALSKLADGSVMVVEAERTRAPVASECKRLIENGGGRVLGAVMNRRRLYIPDLLYRMCYNRVSI